MTWRAKVDLVLLVALAACVVMGSIWAVFVGFALGAAITWTRRTLARRFAR